MKEEWLFPAAIIPVDRETTAALVAEIKRLIDVVGGMALAQPVQEPEPDELTIVYMSGLNDGKKAEREACAKIARKVANATRPDDFALDKCYEIENAIRSKGNT
jgi:hypothetical protein